MSKRNSELQARRHARIIERLSPAQQVKRQERIEWRAQVSKQEGITRGLVMGVIQVLRRGFLGRLKWLIRGQ